MSDESAEASATSMDHATVKATVPMVSMLLACVVASVLSLGGAGGMVFWLAKSGKLPAGPSAAAALPADAEPMKTRLVALDPLLVNLADEGGRCYLRIAMTLKVEDPPPSKNAKPKEEKEKGSSKNEFEAAERDAALSVLGKETTSSLLSPDGKDAIKKHLREALGRLVPEVKVDDVLITEFLVQR